MRLAADELGFRFRGGNWLFRGVSWELNEGSSLAVLGPSGCGKSTFLAVLASELAPSEGRVCSDPGLQERAWGRVHQPSALLRSRTVLDNIALHRYAGDEEWAQCLSHARRIAAELDLEPVLDRRAGQVSGGEAQRTGIGRALISGARVILADEPTAGLDAVRRDKAVSCLQRFPGILVVATHDPAVAEACSSRVELGG